MVRVIMKIIWPRIIVFPFFRLFLCVMIGLFKISTLKYFTQKLYIMHFLRSLFIRCLLRKTAFSNFCDVSVNVEGKKYQ